MQLLVMALRGHAAPDESCFLVLATMVYLFVLYLQLLCLIGLHSKLHVHYNCLSDVLLTFSLLQDGFTPFHMACQEGHKDIVSLLWKHGADLQAVTKVRRLLTVFPNYHL